MKKLVFTILFSTLLFNVNGQKLSVAVLDFDTRNYDLVDANQIIQKSIVDLIRIDNYEVVDKYDIEYISQRDSVNLMGCFSKICLADIGKRLECDYILTGSLDQLGLLVSYTFRLFDVSTGRFINSASNLFLDIPEQSIAMTELTINTLFDIPNDEETMRKLTVSEEYESMLNNPDTKAINNTGPRLGYTVITGQNAKILTSSAPGGFNYWAPSMFSFGFQFEQVFINSGNFQALIEAIPMLAGIEYGRIVPSVSTLMGMRNSRTGWEFAIGPNVTGSALAEGYVNDNNIFLRPGDNGYDPTDQTLIERIDSRGDFKLSSGLMIAIGKTFKSGKMNFPLNFFAIPPARGNSWRVGISTGFNIIQKKVRPVVN
jgi:TolB-like protein